MPRSSSLTTSALVAILIAGLSFLVLLALLYAFCRCRRTHAAKKQAAAAAPSTASASANAGKDYEADASLVATTATATGTTGTGTATAGGGGGAGGGGTETQSLPLPPPPPPYFPTGSLDSKQLDGGMELTLTALHDPDEQLNMQQGEMHSLQQQHASYGKQATGGLYGMNPPSHANGYGYHVTSAIGVDGDSYQVLPSSAGHHGECK